MNEPGTEPASDPRADQPASRRPSPTDQPDNADTVPVDLRVKLVEQKLYVDWRDGHRSVIDLSVLRARCPCAACRTEREQRDANPLQILRFDPSQVRAVNARLVGRYALQLEWSDGHRDGLFEFKFLRTLG